MGKVFSRYTAIAASIVVISMFAGVAQAQTWWNKDWQYRRKIVLNTGSTGANIKGNLDEVPVLLRLSTGNFSFDEAKKDGSDIRFIGSDDKVPLKFQRELYDPADEIALFWVRVPRVMAESNQNFLYIYYGNKSAPDGQEPAGVYDVDQALVYHLDGEEGKPKDQTAYKNNPSDFSAARGTTAVIGPGVSLNGSSDKIVIPRKPSLDFSKGFTFSAWVRISQPQTIARLFSWEDANQSLIITVDQTKIYASATSGGNTVETAKTVDLPPKSWHLIAVTAQPSKMLTLYVDGREAASANLPGPIPEPTADLCIGASLKGTGFFSGDLDEVELSRTARPAAWFQAAFKGQGPDNDLASVLKEDVFAGGGESLTIHLLKVVARAITLDGWIVIGILVVLGAICWIVFLTKILSLRQLSRANDSFAEKLKETEQFDSLHTEEENGFASSSLYRIYAAGHDELKAKLARAAGENGGGSGVSKKIVGSVRSALDKATMLESRQMGAGLVVLTLGISGGPFLGLFGTVWGVMNTFAGMAEAGQANLAAIAPGVASALACTLCGLVVAIPALFAYSFLTQMIKDITADMYQFTEEFILQLEGEE